MEYIPNILFALALIFGITFFTRNVKKLSRNIKLGKDLDVSGNTSQRWRNMARIALGQSKMVVRPIAGLMHIIVYVGFIIINIEVLEIIIDGLLGTHRIFAPLGTIYNVLIGSFEVFGLTGYHCRCHLLDSKKYYSIETVHQTRNGGLAQNGWQYDSLH